MNPPVATPTRIRLPRAHPDVREAERAGIDLDLLEDNLNLTYAQRMLNYDRVLALHHEYNLQRETESPSTEAERERRAREEIISFSPNSNFLCIIHS